MKSKQVNVPEVDHHQEKHLEIIGTDQNVLIKTNIVNATKIAETSVIKKKNVVMNVDMIVVMIEDTEIKNTKNTANPENKEINAIKENTENEITEKEN